MNKIKKAASSQDNTLSLKKIQRNVPNHKHVEADLKTSNKLFRELLENVNLIAVLLDVHGKVTYCNPYFLTITGYTQQEMIGSDWFERIISSANPETSELFINAIKNGKIVQHFKNAIITKSGTHREIFWNNTVLRNTSGALIGTASIGEDITERKHAENEIERTEKRFRSLVENIHDMITMVDSDGNAIYTSPAVEKITGFTLAEIQIMPGFGLIHPEELEETKQSMAEILHNPGIPICRTNRLLHKDGHWIWAEGVAINLLNDENIKAIVTNYRDISERKKSEEALSRSEKLLSEAQRIAHLGSWVNFLNGKMSWSDEVYRIFGLSPNTFKPNAVSFMNLIHPDDRKAMRTWINTYLAKGNPGESVFRFVLPDGSIRFIKCCCELTCDDMGKPLYMSGTGQDVTDNKMAAEIINDSQLYYYNLFDEAPLPYQSLDEDMNIIVVNQAWLNLLGYEKSEVIGKFIGDFLTPSSVELLMVRFPTFKNRGWVKDIEFEFKTKQGSNVTITLNGNIQLNEQQQFKATHCILVNVSERKQFEEDLIKSKEKAQESDRLKTVFLQNMSHELRTPMNAIMGFSDLLTDNFNNKAKLLKFTNIIKQRSTDLLNLINEILDLSKIETGQLPINIEDCNLADLFKELYLFFINHRQNIGKTNIDLQFISDCAPQQMIVRTDVGKLKQIFINLIYNALKFTHKGIIQFGCKTDDNNKMMFFVSDTGIGIPENKQTVIFERFVQLDIENRSALGGTGLGLSIVKGLVELLGGEITLKSIVGEGSTFYFSVPYQIHESSNNKAKTPLLEMLVNWKAYTLLIVEDDIYNTEFLKELLLNTEINILSAINAKQAIEIIESSKMIDIILMDIKMPGMNGLEATTIIKSNNPQIKIIAQTAYATHNDKEKAINAGCDDYIAKPINKELLISMMGKQLYSKN